jgi:hypothetical protein
MAHAAHPRDAGAMEANRIWRAIDHLAWWLDYHLTGNRRCAARERMR